MIVNGSVFLVFVVPVGDNVGFGRGGGGEADFWKWIDRAYALLDVFNLPVFLTTSLERISNVDTDTASLEAILDVTPYSNEEELKEELQQLRKQKTGSGTKIVLFNLKW